MLLTQVASLNKLDNLKNLGYDGIDVSFCSTIYKDGVDPYPRDTVLDGDWKKTLDGYKEKLKKYNMVVESTHLPYNFDYADDTNPRQQEYFEMTVKALEASEYMGAKWAVAHIHLSLDEGAITKTVDYVKKLMDAANIKTIGVAIENACGFPMEYVNAACDILKADGYNVGHCLDLGHANYGATFEAHILDVLRAQGDRISMIHLHDNCHNADYHREPYAGNMPWEDVMKTLKEIGFTGTFNYELMDSRIPKTIKEDYDKYCVKLARYLIDIFDNA